MKKRFDLTLFASLFLLLAVGMASCSDSNLPAQPDEEIEYGTVKLNLKLNKSGAESRATAPSTMRPTTTWKNIKQVMMLLYDYNGVIRWSHILSSQAFDTLDVQEQLHLEYPNIPTGDFHFIAVANCDLENGRVEQYYLQEKLGYYTDSLGNRVHGYYKEMEPITFTEATLYNLNAADLRITHHDTPGKFLPDFYRSMVDHYVQNAGYPVRVGVVEPGEIFRGGNDNLRIVADRATDLNITLTRDVSLLRVRFNPEVLNSDGLVDFTKNCGIFISNIPEEMHIPLGGASDDSEITLPFHQPASTVSLRNSVIAVYNENGTFYTEDPTEGYEHVSGSGDGHIVTPEFPMWRDVILFPTAALAANNNAPLNPYIITISAFAHKGHKLHDGSIMQEDGTVYWSAYLNTIFKHNHIYEYNITLNGGGTYPLPPDPANTPAPGVQLPHLVVSDIQVYDWFGTRDTNIKL